jgi:hypothetical protein
VYALYQLICRGGRIEIEPEWVEWLLDSVGIGKQNAGIRVYPVKDRKRQVLIQKLAGLKNEIPTFLNLLFYLSSCKRKFSPLEGHGKISEIGGKIEKNWFRPAPIILVGAPGTGKTSLIRALASEIKVPVVYQCLGSFSDASANFTSLGFGRTVPPRAVQRGFREARSQIPAIFFLDEIDSLGGNRSASSLKSTIKHKEDALRFPPKESISSRKKIAGICERASRKPR